MKTANNTLIDENSVGTGLVVGNNTMFIWNGEAPPVVGWTGTINGISSANIAKINGIPIANIAKVNGI